MYDQKTYMFLCVLFLISMPLLLRLDHIQKKHNIDFELNSMDCEAITQVV